jgi:hypothetical protein
MTTFVSGMVSPTRAASPLWSMIAKTSTDFAVSTARRRSTVSVTPCALHFVTIPSGGRGISRVNSVTNQGHGR